MTVTGSVAEVCGISVNTGVCDAEANGVRSVIDWVGWEIGRPAEPLAGAVGAIPDSGASAWQAARRNENTSKGNRIIGVRFNVSSAR